MGQEKEKSEQRRQYMLEGSLPKVICSVAIPMVITMLIDSLYNMADAFFVSRIGDAAIAAVGVNDSLMNIIRAVSMGFGMGCASYISRALGAKRDEDASRAAVTTLFTAIGVMIIIVVIGSLNLLPLVNLLGATDTVRPYSMQYARWILIAAPVTAADSVLSQILRSEGSTIYSMIGMSTGCLINVILDPIFINNFGLGVAGAAIATDISKIISLLILLWPFFRHKCVIHLRLSYFTPKKELYLELARMGFPTMLRTSLMSVSSILMNNIAASFSDAAMASVSVANKSLRLVGSAIMGFGQGFQPVAGYSFGAKKFGRVVHALRFTLSLGAAIGITLGAAMGIFAPQVIGIFSKDPSVMEIGVILIRTQSVTLVPHVWTMIATGLFQAIGKAMKAGILGLSRQLLVLIPCLLILPRLFGVTGLAWSQATADVISFILATIMTVPTIREIMALHRGEIIKDR